MAVKVPGAKKLHLVPFDFAVRDLLGLFEVVVLFLGCVETLDLVILKRESLPGYLGKIVDKANHGLGALRVELFVVASFDLRPLIDAFLLCLLVWVLTDTVLDVVAEIGEEAHSIVQLNV